MFLHTPEKEHVLIVDDDPLILELLEELIVTLGHHVSRASNLGEARKLLRQHPDISILLCDHVLPDGAGLSFCQELKSSHPDLIRILVTAHPGVSLATSAINEGEIFRFITKPCEVDQVNMGVKDAVDRIRLVRENKRLQAALVSGNEELRKANQSLQEALSNSVKVCLDVLDRFDHVLAGHSSRVAKWSLAIGKIFNLSDADLDTLDISAQMHDIGLISVSRSFHRQQQVGFEDLPPLQQSALQMHPKTGAELTQFLSQKGVPQIIQAHHEWFNGRGYPARLGSEQIPLLASIIAVPDAYDEYPANRSEAAQFIEENIGTRFHPEVARCFLRLLEEKPDYSEGEREVLISELQAEMRLTCNLYSASGFMLAPKGQTLTPKLIQYIRQHDQSDPLTQRIFVVTT